LGHDSGTSKINAVSAAPTITENASGICTIGNPNITPRRCCTPSAGNDRVQPPSPSVRRGIASTASPNAMTTSPMSGPLPSMSPATPSARNRSQSKGSGADPSTMMMRQMVAIAFREATRAPPDIWKRTIASSRELVTG
jgi:hypothetical protein